MQLVAEQLSQLPFPHFYISDQFDVLAASKSAMDEFPKTTNFLELVDVGSYRKAKQFILEKPSTTPIELLLRSINNRHSLYDVYTLHEKQDRVHLFLFNKEREIEKVQEIIRSLETQLFNLNVSLLDKKVKLEKSLKELQDVAMDHDQLTSVGKLAASIAHEIRNPLTTVKGFIQLLKPYLVDIGKEQYANVALDEINRANDIIYEFLNSAKPQRHKKETVHLTKVLQDVALLYESEAILRNINISYIPEKNEPLVTLDTMQMKQVLVNIIKNAIEAAELSNAKDTFIRLTTHSDRERVTISIEDNGPGMSPETIENLFIPFYSTKEKGTGIGLSVCKKIIKEHNGTIRAESQLGKGTTFHIQLPLYNPPMT
ncbi:ATP-binding protein [Bacillus fonticola]|uniref:ATP-binding protein n=1 Tax=Bacillus fonticola TaxID=2728853 RepID=UPI001473654D|nr:ATP-binding protein [Bacillus fonticola]